MLFERLLHDLIVKVLRESQYHCFLTNLGEARITNDAAAIWKGPSAQSAAPDVWPQHRKQKPTVSLEEQSCEATRRAFLPSAMEDLRLQADPAEMNVCLCRRKWCALTVSWCLTLVKYSWHLPHWRKRCGSLDCAKMISQLDDTRSTMNTHWLQGPRKLMLRFLEQMFLQ